MVNFRVIENNTVNDENLYEEFIEKYNNGVLMKDIMSKLGLNNYMYRKFRKQALADNRIQARSKKKDAKYYSKNNNGTYSISRRCPNTGQRIHYGTAKTEEEAKDKVEWLKKHNWRPLK